jgi:predicted nucleic acid-binding protein
MTSFLTWDEVVWNIRKHKDRGIAVSEGRQFLSFPNLIFIHVDETIISIAQNIMERYGTKPRDSIHASSAISHGAKEIISSDPDFDKVKELKRIPIEKFKSSSR